MSVQYQGSYSSETFNAAKRYKLKFQKNVPLADIELSELNKVSDSFVRQLVSANFPTGSTINNGFKIVESTTPTNNFTIKGGDGTVNGAGVLFVDGYILFLKNDIEYNGQDATGNLTDDGYTETDIPALTTPTGNRTDEVYVDFYFAEVSGTSGSEYEDSSLLISGIGINTANRIRMVQDIRVAEGGTTPANGNDLNGIYHWYTKIATINRLGGNASITNAMITDNRILINSNYSYMNGTAGTIKLVDGADIGDSTHRISNIYMNSNIDFENKLSFSSNGEKICFTTDGKIGIGTTNPQTSLHIVGDSTVTGIITGTLSGNASTATEASRLGSVVHLNGGNVGIGTTNPTSKLHVVGDTLLTGNLTVNGTTTTVNTEVTTTDMMVINQNDNQVAFSVNQTAANSATVMEITNAGSGHALTIGNGNVGIGTISPIEKLQVNGNIHLESSSNSYISSKNNLILIPRTLDGTDNKSVVVSGGGERGNVSRGATLYVFGNEYLNSHSGDIWLLPGSGTGVDGSTGAIQMGGKTYWGTRPTNDTYWQAAFGKYFSIYGADENESYLLHNMYWTSGIGWRYRETTTGAGATNIQATGNTFIVKVAPDGIKDAAITFSNYLILDQGKLATQYNLNVGGSATISDSATIIRGTTIGYSNSSHNTFVESYSCPINTWVPIYVTIGRSFTLVNGYNYKITLITAATSTSTGANYIVYQTAGNTWTAKLVSSSVSEATVSNIPILRVNGTNIEIKQNHGSQAYDVTTYVTQYVTGSTVNTNKSFFGLDSLLTVVGDYLGIGTANPTSKLQVQGAIQVSDVATTCKNLGITRKPYFPLGRPTVCNLALTDASLKGFIGGFTDGRYGYFVPNYNGGAYHGKIARVDLNDFSTVSVLNLANTDVDLKGFQGGFTDGRYGYFVPYNNGARFGKVARVDLNDFSTVTVLDLTLTDASLKGFIGGFTDGRYGYFVPYYNGKTSGKVARVDLNDFSTVSVLDLALTDSTLKGFIGGFTDGRYGYFVPYNNDAPFGKIARVDLNDFSTVSVLDLALTDVDLKGFQGGFTDGRYGYFVPYNNGARFGKVARVDLNDFSTVTVLDLSLTDPALKGFFGGFTDGRYGYFVPYNNGETFGKVARVDLNDFSTVSVLNLALTDNELKGFNGGFTDGRYGYFVPYTNGAYFGKVARIMVVPGCSPNGNI